MPSLTFRFTPNYVKAKELIQQGKLGEVTAVVYREWIPGKVLAAQWPAGGWMWNLEKSGGPLFTLAVWSIDLFRWLLDSEITQVQAATKYTVLEQFGKTLGYDSCVSVRFAKGAVGNFQYSGTVCDSGSGSTLEVVGSSTAVIQATNNDMIRLFEDNPPKTEWNVKQEAARSWGHYQQDQHFVQCLLAGKQPCISPQDGRKAMEIALEIGKAK
jgi:myo-inositol 2-dehydrogenase/D-chiro-inositol 1-dehydrogenase/scyllo-inositol 2-dehydrogenase (NAD+)